jgi:hypothetical protein
MGLAFLKAVRLALCFVALAACEEGSPTPERVDPDTANEGSVSSVADMRFARAAHTATRLRGGDVLVAGGFGEGEGDPLATAELYDVSTDSFVPTGDMTIPRQNHTATPLPDGRVLVSGGHLGRGGDLRLYTSAELYDPATGRFSRADRMTMPRHKHDAVGLADARVLIVGGADESEPPRSFATAEIYDPATGSFRATGNLNLARYKLRGTSILQEDGRVVVVGGADGPEVYEPVTGDFARLPGSFGRTPLFAAASEARGGVLLCGGYSSEGGPTEAAWLVSP